MQNTNKTDCRVVLFSTSKIKSGLFKEAYQVDNQDAMKVLGAYFAPPGGIDFQDTESIRNQLQLTGTDPSHIDTLLRLLTNPSSSDQAKTKISQLLANQKFIQDYIAKPIYTVGNYVYAVNCLDNPDTNGLWVTTLCNCVSELLQNNEKLAGLYLFLHASDISGEEAMGEAYKEVTPYFFKSIKASKISDYCDSIRVFLFHHVDNVINSALENYTKAESANIYTNLNQSFEKDNECIRSINELEDKFIIRTNTDEK